MRKYFLLALFAVLALSLTANAASLVVNLVAQSGSGYAVSGDGGDVTLDGTATQVKIGVYAVLTGDDPTQAAYLQTLYCNFKATSIVDGITGTFDLGTKTSINGNLIGDYASPYDASTSTPSLTSSLIGDPTSISYNWVARSGKMNNVTGGNVLLGYIYYDVSDDTDGYMEISYIKAIQIISTASFRIDGRSYIGSTGYDLISAGQSVMIGTVPEPSTFALLGIGGLAILFFRRK